jgi:hypothetical protein
MSILVFVECWSPISFHTRTKTPANNETQNELPLHVRHGLFGCVAEGSSDAAQSYHCGILPIACRIRLTVNA